MKVLSTSVLMEKGSDYEGGIDSGKVQLGLELRDPRDPMVANNRNGPVSENNLAHEDMVNGTVEDRLITMMSVQTKLAKFLGDKHRRCLHIDVRTNSWLCLAECIQ